ncbi:Thioredoxin [Candidatus Hodgkinia cicadicola]|nr:Thioredoxin [Candidatus Hodgkinia cicadicola]
MSQSRFIILVLIWSGWCEACKRLVSSVIKVVPSVLELKFKMLNFDINYRELVKFGIRHLPILILFRDNRPIGIKIGSLTVQTLCDWLTSKMS